jgi:CheY-like chemotaxis protein
VAIVVEDDGPGFGTGTLEHAARPFFTTKPGHLGLGLSIATRIARRAGGKVELAPGSTGGARATLSVPAAEPLRAAEPAVDPAPRILLVDDNEPARISLAAILEDSGALVTEAASLAEARARVRGADGFDLVILDVQLGDGLGTELIPDLRRRFPVATIAILSGSPADDGVGEADLVLAKAADPNAILAEFHHALRKEVPLGNARVAQG